MFIVAGPQSSRKTSEIKKQLHSWETVVERVPMSSLHNRFHCLLSMEFRQPQNYEFRNINLNSITHTVLKKHYIPAFFVVLILYVPGSQFRVKHTTTDRATAVLIQLYSISLFGVFPESSQVQMILYDLSPFIAPSRLLIKVMVPS